MAKLVKLLCLMLCNLVVTSYLEEGDLPPVELAPSEHSSFGNLVLVSTIDGRISAFDSESGHVVWAVQTDPDGLFNSSLSRLEVYSQGKYTRLVPSLDGHLFTFDGTKMELLPITVDMLLFNSYKFGENLVMVGKKEVKTYGIHLQTGEVRYSCGTDGCERFAEVAPSDDILVVTKQTLVVRAVNSRSGTEEWHFAVGEHSINFLKGFEHDLNDAVMNTHANNKNNEKLLLPVEDEKFLPATKVVVAMMEGIIGMSGQQSSGVLWSQKLPSPIVDVWQLKGNNVAILDILNDDDLVQDKSLLLVGNYEEKLYVKMSNKNYASALTSYSKKIDRNAYYLPTYSTEYQSRIDETRLSIGENKNMHAKGIIFLETNSNVISNETQCDARMSPSHRDVRSYTWYHVLVISVIIAVTLNILIYAVYRRMFKAVQVVLSGSTANELMQKVDISSSNQANSSSLVDSCLNFSSRFQKDFKLVEYLGQGAFGVVFHTRNVVDDCDYAVKRICLFKTLEINNKVMREAKALAALDHPGIVRYFNSWIEEPPVGWQENEDKKWKEDLKNSDCYESSIDEEELSEESGSSAIESCDNQAKSHRFNHMMDDKCHNYSMRNNGGIVMNKDKLTEGLVGDTDYMELQQKIHSSSSKSSVTPLSRPKTFLYIQMQLCKKETLKDWLWRNNSVRTHSEVLDFFHQIVSAVNYVHKKKFMHRDLKPSNIFFALDGALKIGDFGLVTTVSDKKFPRQKNTYKRHKTSQTSNVGTSLYMSPELMQRKPYNHTVDIYSLGIILIELLHPFTTEFERIKVLSEARSFKFPKALKENCSCECEFACQLLSPTAVQRPSAEAILNSNIFKVHSSTVCQDTMGRPIKNKDSCQI